MSQVIIYKTDEGAVAIIVPAPDCLLVRTIEEIAKKDVPYGKPYKIVNAADIPSDWTFRDAWEIDNAILTDGIGAESNEFEVTA
jgi:hypothetical protein